MEKTKKQIALDSLKKYENLICELNDCIWDYAELKYEECKSAEAICKVLESEGFLVERGVADIPTAFKATYGKGHPVIGILGEYDALEGMGQVENITEQKSNGSRAGHACGHNQIASSTVGAALIVKEYLTENDISGTVVYFGCPAEEGGAGKTFMVREGVFEGVDIALSDHPESANCIRTGSSCASVLSEYSFHGIKSHPAGSPEAGRSAFDAIEIFDIGINFLREHMPQRNYIHYAVTYAGGSAPNIIPDLAKGIYCVRANNLSAAYDLDRRMELCAKGAAIATETTYERKFLKASNNLIPNETCELVMQANLEQVELPEITPEENAHGWELYKGNLKFETMVDDPPARISDKWKADLEKWQKEHPEEAYNNFVLVHDHSIVNAPGATDLGDVSWVCPTASLFFTSAPRHVPCHTWQYCSLGKSSIVHKSIMMAAKVVAGSVIDFLENPELVQKAWEEHKDNLPGPYMVPMDKDTKPIIPASTSSGK